ncbi:sugar phosphate isomerase/epimerase [Geomicrobium halophilum]|uniref:Sugar phosphate isomerase/epimerase n=1 Tax=Geomicrobium halophilum TaxID=549000 RepID=A0A841Q1Q7_9BACL|nr:sugar phosphate isomerase/epimerase [Geomicrobium halophilum]MBB6449918.1 sugar phosphate isomerase/epimerase [Geomicrobium halophilum]
MVQDVGVSISSYGEVADMGSLQLKLKKIESLGLQAVELPVQGLQLLKNGVLNRERLSGYKEILRQFDLQYALHLPHYLNLSRPTEPRVEKDILFASIDVAEELGVRTLVYHPIRFIGEEQFLHPHSWSVFNAAEKEKMLYEERQILTTAGEQAKKSNLVIGMENMRPFLDRTDYCYAVNPGLLVEQVREINHSHVGLTLDVGHLHIATNIYDLDFKEQLMLMAPHLVHLHIHDNFGKACFSTEKNQYELIPQGRGDMHAPIGSGSVPFDLVVDLLPDTYPGMMIHELRPLYEDRWSEIALKLSKDSMPFTQ